jgi:adenine-specific DNA-methyltransferase
LADVATPSIAAYHAGTPFRLDVDEPLQRSFFSRRLMIKYIGSKRLLIETITQMVDECEEVRTVLDLFSGTSRVGQALKTKGYSVAANDYTAYAHALARCYIEADAERYSAQAEALLPELRALPGRPGYFTETFCERSRYLHPKNGERVDAIRERIAQMGLDPLLESILLVSLMEAADRVDSTTGVQMAFLKKWAPRAHNELDLRMPALIPGEGRAHRHDAIAFAESGEARADLVYLDPPYNQHAYLGNYHVWESLVTWDKPEVYGIACKRIDCKERKSPFNSKRKIHDAMRRVVSHLDARYILVSFNNEGFISREEMVELLEARGEVEVIERPFERYVGAKIGIYNPEGKKVGKVTHTKNKEFLFRVRVDNAPAEVEST